MDFKDCFYKQKNEGKNADAAIKENERQQAIVDRIEELRAQMNQRLDSVPGLRARVEALSQPIFDDPDYAKASTRFDRAIQENHPETARGLINEMNDIAESKPERLLTYELVPEFRELKEIEKVVASRPHPVQECLNFRDDYLECLHGAKFLARHYEIARVAQLKKEGKWDPSQYVRSSGI